MLHKNNHTLNEHPSPVGFFSRDRENFQTVNVLLCNDHITQNQDRNDDDHMTASGSFTIKESPENKEQFQKYNSDVTDGYMNEPLSIERVNGSNLKRGIDQQHHDQNSGTIQTQKHSEEV